MDQMLSECQDMRMELQALSRKDLQALAKQEGIRANGKSADIIDTMLQLAFPDLFGEASSKKHQATALVNQPMPAGKATAAAAGTSSCRNSTNIDSSTPHARNSSSSRLVQADAGNHSIKDQAAALQHSQAAAGTQSSSSTGESRSSGSGRKTWKQQPQAHDLAAAQLQPKMQQLNLSPPKGLVGRQLVAPAGQQPSRPVVQSSAVQAAAVVALPRNSSRPSSAGTDTSQQQQATKHAGVMPCSRSTAQPSLKSGSSSPTKQGPWGQDQLKCKHLAPSAAVAATSKAAEPSKAPAATAAPGAAPNKQQQQREETPPTPGHMLHTPMRVRVKDNSSTVAAIAPTESRAGMQTAAMYRGCNARAGAVTPPRQGAVTPHRQQIKALTAAQFSAHDADSPIRAGRPVTPLRGTAAGGPFHSSNSTAAAVVGLMSPRLAAMGGSARRLVSTQSRTAGIAGAGAGSSVTVEHAKSSGADWDTGAVTAAPAGAAAGPPPTPLQKPAKRTVDDKQVDEGDKQLEALVERCLRIVSPDAAQSVIHGPEPTKRWLQQNIVAPLKRAAPTVAPAVGQTAAAGRGGGITSSSSSTCLAAGFCHRSILLYGPSGCGKTELVHALAREMGANLLYVPAGDLLRSCQDQGQKLIRALMRVARRVSPCVVCFDDAHRSFPADKRLPNQQKILVELTVQLQQLADMQTQLQEKLQQQQRGGSHGSSIDALGLGSPARSKRPTWGLFGAKKAEQQQQQQQQQQQPATKQLQPAYASLAGPIVMVFATRHPEALDSSLLQLLHCRLLLDLPSADTREEMLLSWLMEKEAAVGVQDVEKLTRDTEGFSCNDLLHLCHEAAMRPVQERARRAICMRDFQAAFQKVKPTARRVSPTGR